MIAAVSVVIAPTPHTVEVANKRLPSQVRAKPAVKTHKGKPITKSCWERSFSRAKEFKVLIGCQINPKLFFVSK
ncbi:MAG: hypothetical protein A2786_00055 [Candidatus Chisholmbacteria bacterium RIFCSPHIGHO2_01_FULL_52_32]|uniref:Uncharacterized protein n=1 Tax=Candidatus Chisholmbacteria bacterium RIFCSPHIGHO2_01_FULL_52_32 TaxID=1797591 RepID=A0A1G1VQG8_9BACT|nr:MAG: hypothetical protein A2786_00055 [Candidatus Chisholmbacteria bacterium RIFCSPHIGHO2_01_FULL_52_32]